MKKMALCRRRAAMTTTVNFWTRARSPKIECLYLIINTFWSHLHSLTQVAHEGTSIATSNKYFPQV
jgi:hypothetical protein